MAQEPLDVDVPPINSQIALGMPVGDHPELPQHSVVCKKAMMLLFLGVTAALVSVCCYFGSGPLIPVSTN